MRATNRLFATLTFAVVLVASLMGTAPALAASGGTIDFVAAEPTTYNHLTGSGSAYNERDIGDDVVESLEGGDFFCNDKVVFFTRITAEDSPAAQTYVLTYGFGSVFTGQPGRGFGNPVTVGISSPDTGNESLDGNESVSLVGTPTLTGDVLLTVVQVTGIEPGDQLIVRVVPTLKCFPGELPTGNVLSKLLNVTLNGEDTQAGVQTIPLKKPQDVQDVPASVSVALGACVFSDGQSQTPVTVTITPSGSATVEIKNSDGDTVATFTGSGGTADLAPGDYTWTATAEPGYALSGPAEGTLEVGGCRPPAPTPAAVTVVTGACVFSDGASTTQVTVAISPADSATVVVKDAEGNVAATFTGTGGTASLSPGSYTWEATAAEGFVLEGDTSGDIIAGQCAPQPTEAAVTVSTGPCVLSDGVSSTPVTVAIAPADSATVVVRNADGDVVATFTGTGGSESLPPGSYTWEATAEDGFVLTGDTSGEILAEDCSVPPPPPPPPIIEGSVSVAVGPCVVGTNGKGSSSVTAAIAPSGAATIVVANSDGDDVLTITESGEAGSVLPGDYTWEATASSDVTLTGKTSGEFTAGSCVLPSEIERELPKTGASIGGIAVAGSAIVLAGFLMIALSVIEFSLPRIAVARTALGRLTTSTVGLQVVEVARRGTLRTVLADIRGSPPRAGPGGPGR